jgi:hypothetical protein
VSFFSLFAVVTLLEDECTFCVVGGLRPVFAATKNAVATAKESIPGSNHSRIASRLCAIGRAALPSSQCCSPTRRS